MSDSAGNKPKEVAQNKNAQNTTVQEQLFGTVENTNQTNKARGTVKQTTDEPVKQTEQEENIQNLKKNITKEDSQKT